MKLRFPNGNYVGTHFGGSLFALTDPFYMLILIGQPGSRFHGLGQGCDHPLQKAGKGNCTRGISLVR